MGKGQIIADLGEGQYTVKIIYGGRDRIDLRISRLDEQIAALDARIAAEEDEYKKSILKLQKSALEKSKWYILHNMPDDYETDIWCADETEELSGNIGTIEIPGEDQSIHIQPGYDSNAAYNGDRDGILWPAIAGSGDWAYFNQCLLPGWQKWKPTYRFATITAIDYDADTCSINLLQAMSSQQSLNVNQGEGIDIGRAGFEYEISTATRPGWEQFKADNPTHPLVTNNSAPEKLPSTNALVDQIKAVDLEVNSKHLYATDASYRKVAGHWDIMAGDDENALNNERGDCEDFALTKADKLINDLGIDPKYMQIATCWTTRGDYHALLTVPTSNHGILVLDINTFGVKTKAQIDAANYYRWDLFLTNGSQSLWANDIVQLLTVPVEYMNCNAGAFAVGDSVIVKFEDQNFSQPKVIGFAADPASCSRICFSMDGYVSGGGRNVLAWNPESNSMQLKNAELTEGGVTYKLYMASFSWGDGFVHVGGGLVYKPPEVSYLSEVFKKYDSIGDSFSTDKSLLIGKAWQYGCVLNSEIGLLAGGATYTGADGFDWGNYQGDKTTQAYSRSSDSWANRTDVPERTFYGGNFAINGRGYLVEGLKTWNDIVDGELVYNYQATGASYSYDYDADSWDSIPNPHGDWWTLNSWGGSDGKGWVAEGSAKTAITGGDLLTNEGLGDEHYTTRAHFSFDPVLKTWSAEKRGSVSLGSARGDLSSTKKGASPINVKLGSGGSSYSGKYFKVDSNAWISTISSWSVARTMGSTAGGVGN